MKTKNLTVPFALLFAATFMLLSLSISPAIADEQEQEDIWAEDRAGWQGRHPAKASPERIEFILDRIAENNPERAKELRKLEEENPEQFRAELRELMRRRFEERAGSRLRRHMEGQTSEPGHRRSFGTMPPDEAGPFGRRGRSHRRERMMDRHAEYIQWLEQNYPEEAEKLERLHENDPDLYGRQIMLSVKKYGRIAEASRENPKLAELLKKDFELKWNRDELVKQIADSKESEREELVKELEEIVSQRFDLIVERKQIEYDQLREKLEELKKKVEESESKVQKWKDPEFKQQNIKTRVEKLIDDAQEFRWH